LHDVPLFRDFSGLDGRDDRLLDESTILRFRHVLGKHQLTALILSTLNTLLHDRGLMPKNGTAGDAALIAASVRPKTLWASVSRR